MRLVVLVIWGADRPTSITANVRFAAVNRADPKIPEVDFVRESAEWKACSYGVSLGV